MLLFSVTGGKQKQLLLFNFQENKRFFEKCLYRLLGKKYLCNVCKLRLHKENKFSKLIFKLNVSFEKLWHIDILVIQFICFNFVETFFYIDVYFFLHSNQRYKLTINLHFVFKLKTQYTVITEFGSILYYSPG